MKSAKLSIFVTRDLLAIFWVTCGLVVDECFDLET
jgi:hypothetical protein